MSRALPSELKDYVTRSSTFSVELGQVIEDLEFESAGGKTWYAVDSSELVVYSRCDQSSQPIALFGDVSERRYRVIESYILDRILFRSPRLVLLPSYGIELESFAFQLRDGAFQGLANRIPEMLEEMDLEDSEDAAALVRLSREIEETQRELTEEELEMALLFCQEHANALLSLASESYAEPLSRFQHAIGNAPFRELADLVSFDLAADDAIVERWYRKLRKQRRGRAGQSYMDALAVATVHRANRMLLNSQQKILLITRSSNMSDLLKSECEAGLWRDAGGNVLRHPRSFSAFHRPEDLACDEAIAQLKQRRASLDLFLRSAHDYMKGAIKSEDMTVLQETLEDVKSAWRACEDLAIATAPRAQQARDSRQIVRVVLQMIASRQEFVRKVNERIYELSHVFDRDNEFLGWFLPIRNGESRQIIEESISYYKVEQRKAVLTCTLESMPYTLQFYSPELKQKAYFEGRWELTWHEALDFFKEGFAVERAYERLLAMAYTLGALGHWPLAAEYCERALQEPEEEDPTPRHEGLFFLSLCYRKVPANSLDKVGEAFALLERAARLKADLAAVEDYEDPRYIKERATLMMYHNQRAGEINRLQGTSLELFPIDEIAELLRRARDSVVDDVKLKVQSLNNLCYLYTTVEGAAAELREALDQLESFMREAVGERQWPVSVVDTVVWARYTLARTMESTEDLEALAGRLKSALGRVQRGEKENREMMSHHLKAIESALQSASVKAG